MDVSIRRAVFPLARRGLVRVLEDDLRRRHHARQVFVLIVRDQLQAHLSTRADFAHARVALARGRAGTRSGERERERERDVERERKKERERKREREKERGKNKIEKSIGDSER